MYEIDWMTNAACIEFPEIWVIQELKYYIPLLDTIA